MTDVTKKPLTDAEREAAALVQAEQAAKEVLARRLANTGYDPASVVRLDDGAIECVLSDKVTGATRPAGLRADAKSPFNRAIYAQIEADMGDDIPAKPAPIIPFEDAVAAELARVDELHAEQLLKLTGNATAAERDTWARKLLAARGVLSGEPDDNDVATLTKGAAARGLTLADFAGVIIAKDAAYVALVDEADEFREQARTAITACETTDELKATTDALKAQMATVVAERMGAA